ncbi:hypothetical protein N8T09_21795 [Enterobacter hormaechei subsp. xiangfangensis]|nr:hypothetical protein [Enterobacter hormaechei subsp. xiangfangensis]MCU2421573.1 hypothetical protein [Enterobacter hormaechei subsp. xiangfangensis]MCU2844037.1 hypothetical protein [Enterobacter hormaechei subsp. xiangfangensis]MCU2945074.1 hypothetical protein [Enterobacter hormaechei subsp. xiangfangensis]MCU3082961.1 hypothetical protein [Enterobacter hormaechei subsp. xiangfangensis]
MSTLTKEWLQKTIAELEEERDAVPGAVNEDAANALAAMKLALASLEANSRKLFTCSACGAEGLDEPLESKCHCCIDGAHWVESRIYTAPPAPVSVPAAMEMDDDFDSAFEHGKAVGWNAYRAAMLQGADGTLTNEGAIPVTQFKPVADLYGLTSPTGGETSFTFDAVEARDFIDGGWSCQECVELGRFQEAMLQNGNYPAQSDCCPEQNYIAPAQDGNSPVIPDGWKLVPVDPTEEMNKAGWTAMNEHDAINPTYRAMLAAAPQHEDLK